MQPHPGSASTTARSSTPGRRSAKITWHDWPASIVKSRMPGLAETLAVVDTAGRNLTLPD